jgi:hypothetical protein
MHCYFHIVAPGGGVPDYKGVEVADLGQAREEALSAIHEMREEDPAFARDWAGCELKISDASGVVLSSVALDDLAPSHQGHSPQVVRLAPRRRAS